MSRCLFPMGASNGNWFFLFKNKQKQIYWHFIYIDIFSGYHDWLLLLSIGDVWSKSQPPPPLAPPSFLEILERSNLLLTQRDVSSLKVALMIKTKYWLCVDCRDDVFVYYDCQWAACLHLPLRFGTVDVEIKPIERIIPHRIFIFLYPPLPTRKNTVISIQVPKQEQQKSDTSNMKFLKKKKTIVRIYNTMGYYKITLLSLTSRNVSDLKLSVSLWGHVTCGHFLLYDGATTSGKGGGKSCSQINFPSRFSLSKNTSFSSRLFWNVKQLTEIDRDQFAIKFILLNFSFGFCFVSTA